jgi:hypothetical protein
MQTTADTERSVVRKRDVALRVLQAVGLIGVAIVGGFLIGSGIAQTVDSDDEYTLVVAAFGVSFLLASLEKFVAQAPLLWRWIRTGAGDGLSTFSSFAFLLVVTLATALLAPPPLAAEKEPPPQPVATSNAVLFVNVGADEAPKRSAREKESVFLVPFLFEAGGCDVNSEEFRKGRDLDPSTRQFIDNLTRGLLRCARRDRPVKLQVRGFASSQAFRCPGDGTERSRELNREIANARAQAVVDAIADVEAAVRNGGPGMSGTVLVEPIMWATFAAMKAGQRWSDEEAGTYSHDRAILTRRAEITLIDSSDCEIATGA